MNMLNKAVKLLEGFGYSMKDGDAGLLQFCADRVCERIKNDCNISEIPDGLTNAAIQRTVGEFLGAKLAFDAKALINVEAARIVKSVSVGDTSTSFEVGGTPEERLKAAIGLLKKAGEGEMSCYRKIRW